jgi:hypothetical protein
MKEKAKKIIAYITRTWEDEPRAPHPRLRILPPFVMDVMGYLFYILVIYSVVSLLFKQ